MTTDAAAAPSADPASDAPIADERAEPTVVSSEIGFHGKVWDIRRDVIDYAGTPITREYVDHTGAVAVLAIDDEGRVPVIQQYRHPIRSRDWELPAGLLDIEGEDPLVAAQRELAEEADLVAAEWHLLTEFFTSVGGSNEALRVYLARGVSAAPEAFDRYDEERDIELRWVHLDELVDAVLAHRVQNSILAIGALTAAAARDRDWAPLQPADTPWTRHPRFRG
ncbi:NUDIX hydrolase [Galbitalea sp. SE-J8]|uniref:NUDIX domain-containing protein n=1 Tax=Galbitalea sp. SE-J8 TaxID=3054952 RepID=UPI00259CB374|nr:NUDIX hydrolase [Galbitalea sp. SE-J8]MDM4764307.1 NUDIX hydrolase [Galbitalea sp. SE-J8]